MWNPNNPSYPSHSFYRRSYRMAPPGLVPAVISCQASTCLIIFGIFLLIAGCFSRFVAGDSSPPSPSFDTPFFNQGREDFAKGPRLVGSILLTISSVLIVISLIGFSIAFVLYRKYEKERRAQMLSASTPQSFSNPQTFGQMPTSGLDYPSQTTGFQYPNGYQVVSQNVVYNPTTEPNQPIGFKMP